MKKFLSLLFCLFAVACSSMIPYKDQNLDYLQGIEKDPAAYRGQVVSFGGEVKGTTEDTLRLRLVLKIDAPLYYYATGKGNALSYELLLVTFNKRSMPAMTGIKKGHEIKVLARVSSYETRKNFTGKDIAVLHLLAFAISDRTLHKDFFRPETPDRQLYESWKEGRLFFEESAQEVIARYPVPSGQDMPVPVYVPPAQAPAPAPAAPEPEKGIVFDPEEPTFIVAPQEPQPEPSSLPTSAAPESAPAGGQDPSSGKTLPPETEKGEEQTDQLPPATEPTNQEAAAQAPVPSDPSAPAPAQAFPENDPGQTSQAPTLVPPAKQPLSTPDTPPQTNAKGAADSQPPTAAVPQGTTAPAEALPSSSGAD